MSKPCEICQADWHSKTFCPLKRRKPIPPESKQSIKKRRITYRKWRKLNPPDENGIWTCYLQISALCPKRLNQNLLTLEHVQPKVRAPELKYDPYNIRPACSFCNKLKGSRTLEELVKIWPHLVKELHD